MMRDADDEMHSIFCGILRLLLVLSSLLFPFVYLFNVTIKLASFIWSKKNSYSLKIEEKEK